MSARRLPTAQPDLFGRPPVSAMKAPAVLGYQPELITADEEADLAARIGALDLKPFEFHGHLGKRRVAYFGWRYDFNGGGLSETGPIPDWILPIRDRVADFAGVEPEAFPHVLVTEYEHGAGIGWHRDRPQFGKVAGISLCAPCVLRLRRRRAGGFERAVIALAPRSVYRLEGEVRRDWEHSISPVGALRYSITFRTLALGPAAATPGRVSEQQL